MAIKIDDYIDLAKVMQGQAGNRTEIFQAMEEMFALKPAGQATEAPWIKLTVSPDPRNAVIGGSRMLAASAPRWHIPFTSAEQQPLADTWERLAKRAWDGAGHLGEQIHFTAALSAMLYGECHIRSMAVADLALTEKNKVKKLRWERTKARTPLLFEVVNPKLCYTLRDQSGLTAHLVRKQMLVNEVKGLGGDTENLVAGKKDTDVVYVNDLYTLEGHAVWIDGVAQPIRADELEIACIPVTASFVEGGGLFRLDQNVDETEPFLYTIWKSKMWERSNSVLTAFFSLFFAIVANPLFVANLNDPEQMIQMDYNTPGGLMKLRPNERVEQLMKTVFTQDVQQALGITDQKMVESSMYRTALGEAPGAGAPYSLVALLSQNGRQALIPAERAVGKAAAEAMVNGFMLLKANGEKIEWGEGASKYEVDPKQIPDSVQIEASLEIDLPVDERGNVQMATAVTQGDRPLASYEWARRTFLKIEQSAEMDQQIAKERWTWSELMSQIQAEIAKAQAKTQMEIQKGMAPQMPGQAGPGGPTGPQEAPQSVPAQGPGPEPGMQGAQAGLPMMGPGPQPGEQMPPMGAGGM